MSVHDDPQVEVKLDTRVTSIDRAARVITTDDDQSIGYDKLVLALGSRVRRVPVDGADLPGVHYLRSIADVDAITLSLGGMSQLTLDPKVAVTGILVAAGSNCLVKGAMAVAIGGTRLLLPVALPLTAAAVLGPLTVWLSLW